MDPRLSCSPTLLVTSHPNTPERHIPVPPRIVTTPLGSQGH